MTQPPFIIESPKIDYVWDDPTDCAYEEPRLANRIGSLYGRSILAIAIATAEWVIWRHGASQALPICADFAEACWASIVDRRYLNHLSRKHGADVQKLYPIKTSSCTRNVWKTREALLDKINGPQYIAIEFLGEVADRTMPKDLGVMETTYLFHLAEAVCPEQEQFKLWRRKIITRLSKYYQNPPKSKNWLGPAIPREALNPSLQYDPSDTSDLLQAFLSSLNYEENQFLAKPSDMIKAGFAGKPYSL